MQFPTRELSRPEWDLMRAIQEAAFQKWNPILKDAEQAADQVEKEAERIEAEVKATTEYQNIHRVLHGPSGGLSEHLKTLGNGDSKVGYGLLGQELGEIEAPIATAKAAAQPVYQRLENLKIEADDDGNRLLVLAFLRLGYQAGAQDALNIATDPGSPADILKFVRDLMDDSPATDALIAATVDKILSSPAMAAVIGGVR